MRVSKAESKLFVDYLKECSTSYERNKFIKLMLDLGIVEKPTYKEKTSA